MKRGKKMETGMKWAIFAPIGVVLGLMLLFGTFYSVDAGESAVVLTWGSPNQYPVGDGLHVKVPFAQSVVKFSTRTQVYGADATKDSLESANSKDLQIVFAQVAVNYRIDSSQVVNVYKTLGTDFEHNVVAPIVHDTIKATFAQYNAEEISHSREEIRLKMKEALQEKLTSRNIFVEEVSITKFDYSPEFNHAIEAKVTAEQLKLKAERDLERIEVEKQQKITQAQAEAEALRLQKQEVTPELIQLRQIEMQQKAIEKWNGILPSVTSGTPFINIAGK
jgi:regulator of protease activity HflC (stomatin/prohibitin superfamily)